MWDLKQVKKQLKNFKLTLIDNFKMFENYRYECM